MVRLVCLNSQQMLLTGHEHTPLVPCNIPSHFLQFLFLQTLNISFAPSKVQTLTLILLLPARTALSRSSSSSSNRATVSLLVLVNALALLLFSASSSSSLCCRVARKLSTTFGELPTRDSIRGVGTRSSSDPSRSAMNASSRFFLVLDLVDLTGVAEASEWGDDPDDRLGAR